MTACWSWPWRWPVERTASEAADRARTRPGSWPGMPTTNTFICGTARETSPNATSTSTSAIITGAAISSAITNDLRRGRCGRAHAELGDARDRADRDQLVARGEPQDHQVVAADQQEHDHGEEAVELAEDRGLATG